MAATGNIAAAANASKVGRRCHYDWMAIEEYAAAFREAQDEAVEMLEGEAWAGAIEGFKKPYIYGGEVVKDKDGETIYTQERNATLLIFLLKAARPDKYRDNAKVEHTGPAGGPLSIQVEFVKP